MPQACFGSPQARFWRGLGASWACLRRNLDALGELLDFLGCLCAVSWPPFGCFLGALGRIWALIGASVLDFGWSWAPPGWVLASSGAVFATIFEGDALIAAGIPAWHSHWHFVTSLQRGGTCAAHGIKKKRCQKRICFKIRFCLRFSSIFNGIWVWKTSIFEPIFAMKLKMLILWKLRSRAGGSTNFKDSRVQK